MTDEWHPFPDRDDSSRDTPTGGGHPSTPPPGTTNHDEDTRILPPQLGASHDTAPVARRRTGVLPAAVLAGALVVGGVAGVGGAAGYVALRGDSTSGTSSTPDISASNRSTASNTSNSESSGIESVATKVLPSVVQINVTGSSESGSGSGIVLTKDGTILTNNHVVAVAGNGGSITVNFDDGTAAKATVVGTDPVTDLAVIKAEGVNSLTPAEIGKSSELKVGQGVVAVGSPFGLGATVTSGIVSALDRAVSVQSSQGGSGGQGSDPFGLQQQGGSADQSTTYPAIQTDAAINPGNSGGPLVNMDGQVIGINSSIRTDGSSSQQGGSIGLGFAIPMDEVLPIVNQLRNSQTPTHARLGVSVSDNKTNRSDQTGALIKTLESGGAADDAGLKVGDVITKVDKQLVDGSDALVATIRGHRPGDTVTLTVVRGGKTQMITAKLGSDAHSTAS